MTFLCQLLVAFLLISGSPESDVPRLSVDDFRAVQTALYCQALNLEILDDRETRYILSRHEDFCTDIQLLRRRYLALHDAPRVVESLRFPEREAVNEMLSFNRSYRQSLELQMNCNFCSRHPEYLAIINETEALYQIWDTVRDARCEYYYVSVRRQALKRLRDDELGYENFYAGHLPPYVPIWHFKYVR